MPSTRGRALPVLLAAAVLVGGANLAAYAANGDLLVLGKKNTATKTTTLKNKKGAALSLKSKAGQPALKVSNSEKVTGFNADLVDGFDGSALQNKTYLYTLSGSSATNAISFALPGLPAGRYLVSVNASALPSGGGSTNFGCSFRSGSSVGPVGFGNTSPLGWFVSVNGYLDTTALTYTLECGSDAAGMTVPAVPQIPSQVALTRVDDVTAAAQGGTQARVQGRLPGR